MRLQTVDGGCQASGVEKLKGGPAEDPSNALLCTEETTKHILAT